MRHKLRRVTQLPVSIKSYSHAMRSALTSLITYGHMTTTPKRARAIRAYADHFFSRIGKINANYSNQNDARREVIRFIKSTVFTDEAGKKVVNQLLPLYEGKKASGFTRHYKLGQRKGDGAEQCYVVLSVE